MSLWRDRALSCPNLKAILSLLKTLNFCWNSERNYFEVTPVKALETVMGACAGSRGHMLHADSPCLLFICMIWTNFSAVIYTTYHLWTSQKCPAGEGVGQAGKLRLLAGTLQPPDSLQPAMADWIIHLDDLKIRKSSGSKWSKENVPMLLEDRVCYMIKVQSELNCEDGWRGC